MLSYLFGSGSAGLGMGAIVMAQPLKLLSSTVETPSSERHPMLRNTAVVIAIISAVLYFCIQRGVAGFLRFVSSIFAQLMRASN